MTEAGERWARGLADTDAEYPFGVTVADEAEFWLRAFCAEIERRKAEGDPFPYLNAKHELLGD